MLRNPKNKKIMEHFFSTQNATLIQGATLENLESMVSRLLDEKLANITNPTPEIDKGPRGDGLYKRKETAEKLGISLVTLDKWTKTGIITGRKIGTRVYYTIGDINNALKKSFKE